jgi:hypothetical protein
LDISATIAAYFGCFVLEFCYFCFDLFFSNISSSCCATIFLRIVTNNVELIKKIPKFMAIDVFFIVKGIV